MAGIVIIDLADGRHQINLTHQGAVWGRRQFVNPPAALRYVQILLDQGHRLLFPAALADLTVLASAWTPPERERSAAGRRLQLVPEPATSEATGSANHRRRRDRLHRR